MSVSTRAVSAVGKILAVVVLLAAFLVGMASVVYMSLSGDEIKVPDIVGKDFNESEKLLASLGLKIKRRAERASTEKINTVIEQSPKPGETLKSGNMIFVVVSKAGLEGETPVPIKKDIDTDDTEKIEEMISEKPKKPKANSNTKKKPDTSRDTNSNESNSNSNSNSNSAEEDKGKKDTDESPAAKNRNAASNPAVKPQSAPAATRTPAAKPPGGETRPKTPSKP